MISSHNYSIHPLDGGSPSPVPAPPAPLRRSSRGQIPSGQNLRNIANRPVNSVRVNREGARARPSLLDYAMSTQIGDIPVPDTYKDAHDSDEYIEWTKAERRELESIKKFNTWKVVPLSKMLAEGKGP